MNLKSDNPSTAREDRMPSGQKIVGAVLFADICGSTRLFEKYGDWQARQIETQVLDALMSSTVSHEGAVIKTIGDEIMSWFPNAPHAVDAACGMHRVLKEDKELVKLGIAVRIGLHYGPVLIEKGDLFGDAVNVAARMVSLAKADQIITTRETVRQLPTNPVRTMRNLGRSWVRGKQDEMDIVEIIWHDSSGLTQIVIGGQEELRNLLLARLVLDYQGRIIEVVPSSRAFTLGRGEGNHLVVDRDLVSRSHADIEFRQGKFILVDHSTNGTYLLLENGARFFVRREEIALHDQGVICLGQMISNGNPDLIRYKCIHK
ncbi:MAG: FHA domain-containing protein [Phycisphaerales bacterium]|nr:FHA domain-containing protein [Phycisphaerales bacterium]